MGMFFLASVSLMMSLLAEQVPAFDLEISGSEYDPDVYYAPFDFSGAYTGKVYTARSDAVLSVPKGAALKRPVFVDMLRGGLYDVSPGVSRGESLEYVGLPLVDYPLALTEADLAQE